MALKTVMMVIQMMEMGVREIEQQLNQGGYVSEDQVVLQILEYNELLDSIRIIHLIPRTEFLIVVMVLK